MTSQKLFFQEGLAAAVVLAFLALGSADALAATGSISGTVIGAPSHAAVPGVEACAWETKNDGEIIESDEHCAFTASDGRYEIDQLEAGTYLVLFWPRVPGQNYIPQFYDVDGLWPADPATVGSGPTTGIDMELPEGGSVKGRVTEEVGGKPLAGIEVCATRQYEGESTCSLTDSDGEYEIVGLRTHNYTLSFNPDHSGLKYFGEYYDDQAFGNGYPPMAVAVSAGSVTTGIDAVLTPAAEVRGVVTAAADGRPLSDILVCVAPPHEFSGGAFAYEAKCSRTNASGAYAVKDLEGGRYRVLFSLELRDFIHYFPPLEPEDDGYPTRYWNEQDILWNGDLLTLTAPTVATGIDARLGPFPPTPIASAPLSMPTASPIHKPRCKPGRHLRKVKGKRRCVRRHPRNPRRHKRAHQSPHRAGDRSSEVAIG